VLLRRGRAAMARAGAMPLRPPVIRGRRAVLRVASSPIRGLAGLMLRLQAPARRPT